MKQLNTENMIFVFGSNMAGIHGAGAARHAKVRLGARMGVAVGRTGQCYAIPTKGMVRSPDGNYGIGETLPLETIGTYVSQFLEHAAERPRTHFQVTAIGCGLAGLLNSQLAPLFAPDGLPPPSNIHFDTQWCHHLPVGTSFWGTF